MGESASPEQAIRNQRRATDQRIDAALKSKTLTRVDAEMAKKEGVDASIRSVANIAVGFFLNNVPGIGPALATYVGEKILEKKFNINPFPDVGWGKMMGGKIVRPAFFILGGAPLSYSIDSLRQFFWADIQSMIRGFRASRALKGNEVKDYQANRAQINRAAQVFNQNIASPAAVPVAAAA